MTGKYVHYDQIHRSLQLTFGIEASAIATMAQLVDDAKGALVIHTKRRPHTSRNNHLLLIKLLNAWADKIIANEYVAVKRHRT